MSTHPEVLWAQRSSATAADKNVIYLTVNLPDIIESTLEYALTATSISFKARTKSGGETDYAFDLEFFSEVDAEKSVKKLSTRSLYVVLSKKESKSEYWPRLTKEKIKTPFIKTDFSKWVDEDEQDGNPTVDDELDPGFPGMPGMGGMGGMNDFDLSKFSGDFGAGAGAGAGAGHAEDVLEEDSDDGGPPALEDPEVAK